MSSAANVNSTSAMVLETFSIVSDLLRSPPQSFKLASWLAEELKGEHKTFDVFPLEVLQAIVSNMNTRHVSECVRARVCVTAFFFWQPDQLLWCNEAALLLLINTHWHSRARGTHSHTLWSLLWPIQTRHISPHTPTHTVQRNSQANYLVSFGADASKRRDWGKEEGEGWGGGERGRKGWRGAWRRKG